MPNTTINGISLAYDEWGDPAHPTLIFAHALVGNRTLFSGVAERLRDSFHILNLDLHGHGESGYPTSFSLERMASDCAALLASLGRKRICWVGESMGAMVGMRFALAHPQQLGALVIINSSSQPETSEAGPLMLQLSEAFRAGKTSEVFETTLPLLFSDATCKNSPELVKQYRQDFTRDRDREGIYQAALAVFQRGDITPELHGIAVPTLVLSGSEDVTYPLPVAELIANSIPHARLEIVPDSRHLSVLEQPEFVAAKIREFMVDVSGA